MRTGVSAVPAGAGRADEPSRATGSAWPTGRCAAGEAREGAAIRAGHGAAASAADAATGSVATPAAWRGRRDTPRPSAVATRATGASGAAVRPVRGRVAAGAAVAARPAVAALTREPAASGVAAGTTRRVAAGRHHAVGEGESARGRDDTSVHVAAGATVPAGASSATDCSRRAASTGAAVEPGARAGGPGAASTARPAATPAAAVAADAPDAGVVGGDRVVGEGAPRDVDRPGAVDASALCGTRGTGVAARSAGSSVAALGGSPALAAPTGLVADRPGAAEPAVTTDSAGTACAAVAARAAGRTDRRVVRYRRPDQGQGRPGSDVDATTARRAASPAGTAGTACAAGATCRADAADAATETLLLGERVGHALSAAAATATGAAHTGRPAPAAGATGSAARHARADGRGGQSQRARGHEGCPAGGVAACGPGSAVTRGRRGTAGAAGASGIGLPEVPATRIRHTARAAVIPPDPGRRGRPAASGRARHGPVRQRDVHQGQVAAAHGEQPAGALAVQRDGEVGRVDSDRESRRNVDRCGEADRRAADREPHRAAGRYGGPEGRVVARGHRGVRPGRTRRQDERGDDDRARKSEARQAPGSVHPSPRPPPRGRERTDDAAGSKCSTRGTVRGSSPHVAATSRDPVSDVGPAVERRLRRLRVPRNRT